MQGMKEKQIERKSYLSNEHNEEAKKKVRREKRSYLRTMPGSDYNEEEKNRQPKTSILGSAEASEGEKGRRVVRGGGSKGVKAPRVCRVREGG